jgi:riboflavin synthase
VECPQLISEIQIDDSIAVNGVCLTAVKVNTRSFEAQVVHTSLQKTSLGELRIGTEVNLELALRFSDRLGGHIVQGHVESLGRIEQIISKGENKEFKIKVPQNLLKSIVQEGSIAIDGTSLTVAKLQAPYIWISIIPHTMERTIFKNYRVGQSVNLETDILIKYLSQLARKNLNSNNIANNSL